jgi:DNA polymerase I-like protein with 3'-5' exonuclease and polymerase domains
MTSIEDWCRKKNRVSNLSTFRRVRKVVHQVHDEILTVAPVEEAEETYQMLGEIMSVSPWWAPDLPLASEGGWDRRYIK